MDIDLPKSHPGKKVGLLSDFFVFSNLRWSLIAELVYPDLDSFYLVSDRLVGTTRNTEERINVTSKFAWDSL